MHAKSFLLSPTFCNTMDWGPPGSSIRGILQVKYWSGLLCPPPGDLPDPGIKPASLMCPALAGGFFTPGATWEACCCITGQYIERWGVGKWTVTFFRKPAYWEDQHQCPKTPCNPSYSSGFFYTKWEEVWLLLQALPDLRGKVIISVL